MGYNTELVAASQHVGARYRYFWQGGNPWCQTLSARWLRKRAKGEDWVINALAPLGENPKTRNLGKFVGNSKYQNNHLLYENAEWVPKTKEFSISQFGQVLVADAHFTEKVNAKVEAIKSKICWILQRVDADRRNQYIEYGSRPLLLEQTPRWGRLLELQPSEEGLWNLIRADNWGRVLDMFRKVDSFWLISGKGHEHSTAAFNDGALFTFFDPDAGEFEMSNGVLEKWVELKEVKNTVIGEQKGNFAQFDEYLKDPNYRPNRPNRPEELVDDVAVRIVENQIDNRDLPTQANRV